MVIFGQNAKILVVDDEIKMCSTLKRFLEGNHYEVEIAYNGEEALRRAEEFRPQCVLMDIRMPVLGGIEALKRIKLIRPEVEVIMTTAIANEASAEDCLKLGAFAYVIKPIRLAELLDKIQRALARRRESDGLARKSEPEG